MESTNTPQRPQRALLAFLGLVAVIAGYALYFAMMESTFSRSTGVSAFGPMLIGLLLCFSALRHDRRKRIWGLSALSGVGTVFFAIVFFVLSAIPQSTAFAELQQAPDFSLPDHNGQPVGLYDTLNNGPVLLVTYRGFW